MANGHGGRRAGAGRKPGAVIKRTREIANGAVAAGVTPLEYMLAVVQDKNAEQHRRDEMAKAAAPYIHPRLSNIAATVDAKTISVSIEVSSVPTDKYLSAEEVKRLMVPALLIDDDEPVTEDGAA